MPFNPSTIRPRPRTRPEECESTPEATPVADGQTPVSGGMLAPRVLIRVPRLHIETQTAGPMFAATAGQSLEAVVATAAVAADATLGAATAVVSAAVEEAPASATPFPKGILTFSLAEENSASGLGLAGLWSRVTAVVPAKYVGITAGGLVVILMVVAFGRHRHPHVGPGHDSEAPTWNGAVTGNAPHGGAAPSYPVGTARIGPQAAPAAAPNWSVTPQPTMSQSAGNQFHGPQSPAQSSGQSAVAFAGPTPSDAIFNGQTAANPATTAYMPAPPRNDGPAYGTRMPQQGGAPVYGNGSYGPAQADSVPSMPSRSPAWGGLPPRDAQASAQVPGQGSPMQGFPGQAGPGQSGPGQSGLGQAAPPEGYRTAQRNDPSMIPATRGPGEYGEPGVARLQGTIDRPSQPAQPFSPF
jgi:hypothetical protein